MLHVGIGAGVFLQRRLGVVAAQLHLRVHGGQSLVLPQLHLRVQVDKGGEGIAVRADLLHRQGGRAGDLDIALADGLHQRGGIGVVHRLLIEKLRAVLLFDVLPRGLPADGAHGLHALVAPRQRSLPCVPVHRDGQAHLPLFGDVLPLDDLHAVSSYTYIEKYITDCRKTCPATDIGGKDRVKGLFRQAEYTIPAAPCPYRLALGHFCLSCK